MTTLTPHIRVIRNRNCNYETNYFGYRGAHDSVRIGRVGLRQKDTDDLKQKAEETKQTVEKKPKEAKEAADKQIEKAKPKLKEFGEKAKDATQDAMEKTKEAADSAAQKLKEATNTSPQPASPTPAR